MGSEAHMFWNEVEGAATLAGVQVRLVPNDDQGRLDPADVGAAIRPRGNLHFPSTGMVCLENTHNRCNGGVLTPDEIGSVAEVAHSHGVPVHLDGARIFNAAVCLKTPAVELAKDVDDVSFCLSKGLSAPVGSLLCGSHEFVDAARKWRKMVGGGMRQAGVLAAAGLVALETMVDRLAEDHAHVRRLAEGLAQVPGISLDPPGFPPTSCSPKWTPVLVRSRSTWPGFLRSRSVSRLQVGTGCAWSPTGRLPPVTWTRPLTGWPASPERRL